MLPKIPATTSPLTKFIRTGEGILAYAFGLVLVLVPIITTNLPPSLSTSLNIGKWAFIATIVSRTGLKAIAALKGHGLPDQSAVVVQAPDAKAAEPLPDSPWWRGIAGIDDVAEKDAPPPVEEELSPQQWLENRGLTPAEVAGSESPSSSDVVPPAQ